MDAAGTVNAVISMSIPAVATIVIGLLLRRLQRTRRAREAAEGISRMPALIVAVGWMSLILGALLVLPGGLAYLGGEPFEVDMTIAGAVFVLAGLVWVIAWGRRRITVWGEQVRYRPPLGAERTIWAMDAVQVESRSGGGGTFWVKDRHGHKGSWYRGAFPHRTVTAFRHGVHHHAVDTGIRRSSIGGIDSFVTDESFQMPDGTTATWHRGRVVRLDILVSAPSENLIRRAENGLARAFTALGPAPPHEALPRAGGTSEHLGGVVDDAHIHWERHPEKTAIGARVQATGESGLDSAGRAFAWLRSQLVEGAVQHMDMDRSSLQQRAQAARAFTVTYRETRT